MKSLGFLGLVFDTGLSVTPLMGHLGCLASRWSVSVPSIVFAVVRAFRPNLRICYLVQCRYQPATTMHACIVDALGFMKSKFLHRQSAFSIT